MSLCVCVCVCVFVHRHMTASCPELQAEILNTIATHGPAAIAGTSSTLAENRGGLALPGGGLLNSGAGADRHRAAGAAVRMREHAADEEIVRRVRQRRE